MCVVTVGRSDREEQPVLLLGSHSVEPTCSREDHCLPSGIPRIPGQCWDSVRYQSHLGEGSGPSCVGSPWQGLA